MCEGAPRVSEQGMLDSRHPTRRWMVTLSKGRCVTERLVLVNKVCYVARYTAMDSYLKQGELCDRAPRDSKDGMLGTPHGDGRLP